MQVWVIVFGMPLALYLWLAFMPPGRLSPATLAVLAACILSAWAAFYLDLAGISGRDGPRGAVTVLLLAGLSTAFLLGVSMRLMRRRLPGFWPAWAWPVCVILTLAAIAWPLLRNAAL